MGVDDSIKAYWRFGSDIFWPRRYTRLYSFKKLRKAIIDIVEEYCGCYREERCNGDVELLR